MPRRLVARAMLFVVVAVAAVAVASPPVRGIRFLPDAIPWKPAPPTMPAGTHIAVLEGDPSREEIVTMRLRVAPGFRLPLHTHPADERVTVLSGAVRVGFGDVVDDAARKAAVRYPAGSFYVNPRGVPHFVEADEETVLQVTVQGPWRVDPVTPR